MLQLQRDSSRYFSNSLECTLSTKMVLPLWLISPKKNAASNMLLPAGLDEPTYEYKWSLDTSLWLVDKTTIRAATKNLSYICREIFSNAFTLHTCTAWVKWSVCPSVVIVTTKVISSRAMGINLSSMSHEKQSTLGHLVQASNAALFVSHTHQPLNFVMLITCGTHRTIISFNQGERCVSKPCGRSCTL